MNKLVLFYDGTCPLCVREMDAIRSRDRYQSITLVDIHSEAFASYPNINPKEANKILHAIDQNGALWLGLDAAYKAWKLLGRGWLYAPLRWPLARPLADRAYIYFANNRYQISKLFTGNARCNGGSCEISNRGNGGDLK